MRFPNPVFTRQIGVPITGAFCGGVWRVTVGSEIPGGAAALGEMLVAGEGAGSSSVQAFIRSARLPLSRRTPAFVPILTMITPIGAGLRLILPHGRSHGSGNGDSVPSSAAGGPGWGACEGYGQGVGPG